MRVGAEWRRSRPGKSAVGVSVVHGQVLCRFHAEGARRAQKIVCT